MLEICNWIFQILSKKLISTMVGETNYIRKVVLFKRELNPSPSCHFPELNSNCQGETTLRPKEGENAYLYNTCISPIFSNFIAKSTFIEVGNLAWGNGMWVKGLPLLASHSECRMQSVRKLSSERACTGGQIWTVGSWTCREMEWDWEKAIHKWSQLQARLCAKMSIQRGGG